MRLLSWIAFIAISEVGAELLSVTAGIAVFLSGGTFWHFKDYIKCKLYECCKDEHVSLNAYKLEQDLSELLFGQHLVKTTLVNAVREHWRKSIPEKPLVMSFHGYTGCGKNYVAEIIANSTYKNGMRSPFVHHLVATADYPDKSKMEQYQSELRERIIQSVKKCPRSLFIIDETDKLPEKLLSAIKPFLDYYTTVSGIDFRKATFLFLSNKGGSAIAELTVNNYLAGKPREELQLKDFERVVMGHAYNEAGGLKMSELISNHLIDHFIPFLPLQREHVRKCVESYLKRRGHEYLIDKDGLVDRVLGSLQYFPDDTKSFSSSGCKRVSAKADLEISVHGKHTLMQFDDEL